jgi:tetratricopeptide (TPR) repeat protein
MAFSARRGFAPASAAAGPKPSFTWNRATAIRSVILIVIALWIYWPSMNGGWLWDDADSIFTNQIVLSPTGYWKAWTHINSFGEHILGGYEPLMISAEWLQWRLFGEHTLGYHLVCVALHIASAFLLWRLFHRLGFTLAWLGALLFVVHPIMVESVAWISELKNTLSLPLLLLAMLTWIDFDENGKSESYRATLLWFVLSLSVKSTGLMLPVVMLGYAAWKRQTITVRDLKLAAPFFALSLAAAGTTLLSSRYIGHQTESVAGATFASGLATVGWTTLFLLGKALLPIGLLPDYPSLGVPSPSAVDLVPPLLLLLLVVFTLAVWRRARWFHPAAWGLAFFFVNLIPVLIWVNKNYLVMAWSMDHLLYIPMIGLVGWAIAWLAALEKWAPRSRGILAAAATVLILALALASHLYARVFADGLGLWVYTIERHPNNWHTHYMFGRALEGMNRYPEGVQQLQQAISLNPTRQEPWYELAELYLREGDIPHGKEFLRDTIRVNPANSKAILELAELERKDGHLDEAQRGVEQALAAHLTDGSAYMLQAALQNQQGHPDDALASYAKAVQLSPNMREIRYNYGVALLQAGRLPEAVEQLEAAVDLDDQFAPARENLGAALARSGATQDAIEQFRTAIELDPHYVLARKNLAVALVQTHDLPGALEQYEKVLEIDPNDQQSRELVAKLRSLPDVKAAH